MENNQQHSGQENSPYIEVVPLQQRLRLRALERAWQKSELSRRIALNRRTLLAAVLVYVGYYAGAAIGMGLTFQPHAVSVMWPPNSILMGALLLAPVRTWWIFVLAAFPAHLAVELPQNVPLRMACCWFISNSSEALIGAGLVRMFVPGPIKFDSLETTWIFLACAGFLAPFFSSFLDAAFVAVNHFGSEAYWANWRMRFVSNSMTGLIVTPVIVSVASFHWSALARANAKRVAEGTFFALTFCAVCVSVFWESGRRAWTTPILVYAPLPFLLWAAVRFGPAASSAGVLGLALLVIWGAVHQLGPFSSVLPEESALSMQLYIIVSSVTLMTLAVVLYERRKIQQALEQSEDRYRDVVDSHTDLICRYMFDTTLTFVNESYCRFFKMPRESLLGTRFLDLIPASSRPAILEKLQSMTRDGSGGTIEHEVCLPDGTIRWQSWIDRPVFGIDGEILEFQGIGRDVTERKRVEQAQLNLAHTSRLVLAGELTAMVAHEINQPLGAILSNAEAAEMLLQSSQPNLPEVQQILADIRRDNLRASEAIRRIRTLLRKRPMEMLPVNLNDVASDVVQLVSGDAMLRRVQIERDLSATAAFVAGDKVHLQQLLLNLILNGMDATAQLSKNRKLTISTSLLEGKAVEMTVADNGPGIPAEKLARVFDFFFSTKPDGMGLGLAIARSIVEAHEGNIHAENSADGGALFRCRFPNYQSESELGSTNE